MAVGGVSVLVEEAGVLVAVIYVDAAVAPSAGNALRRAGGVVVERPVIDDGDVQLEEILKPGFVAALDNIGGDVVTALAHTLGHTENGLFGRGEAEEEEGDEIAALLRTFNQFDVRAGGQRGLESKGLALLEQMQHTVDHQTARLDGHALGIEGRETARDFVSIDKLAAVEHLGQNGERGRGLARAVAPGDDV